MDRSETEGVHTLDLTRGTGAPVPWTFEQSVKDPAVEEPVDLHFHRRLAFPLVRAIQRLDLRVTPSQITVVSMVLGVAGGWAYWYAAGDAHFYVIGTMLLLASITLDCADGMLARLRKQGSHFGMLLDGFCDLIVGIAVWYGVAYASTVAIEGWWVWPAAFSVLVSIVLHCAFYDAVKNSFSRLASPQHERGALPIDAQPGKGFGGFMQRLYTTCYGGVAKLTGGDLDRRLEAVDHETYRAAMAPVMRAASFLGLGTHLAIMYCACLFGLIRPDAPFWVAMGVVVGALNLGMVVTFAMRRRVSLRLLEGAR
jgi:phosphatidylglycerophosphate synthase